MLCVTLVPLTFQHVLMVYRYSAAYDIMIQQQQSVVFSQKKKKKTFHTLTFIYRLCIYSCEDGGRLYGGMGRPVVCTTNGTLALVLLCSLEGKSRKATRHAFFSLLAFHCEHTCDTYCMLCRPVSCLQKVD